MEENGKVQTSNDGRLTLRAPVLQIDLEKFLLWTEDYGQIYPFARMSSRTAWNINFVRVWKRIYSSQSFGPSVRLL